MAIKLGKSEISKLEMMEILKFRTLRKTRNHEIENNNKEKKKKKKNKLEGPL